MEETVNVHPTRSQLLCPKASIKLWGGGESSELTGAADI